jgi:hypothetical protein
MFPPKGPVLVGYLEHRPGWIEASTVIAVDDSTGDVVFFGSAGDEG